LRNINATLSFLRRLKWEDNIKTITKHNNEEMAGLKTYKLAMNKFGDLVREKKCM
jgi:hypothetical protein